MKFLVPLHAALILAFFASADPASSQDIRTHHLTRWDSSQLTYHLGNRTDGESQGVIMLFQGSGCNRVAENANIPRYGAAMDNSSVIVTIEKYGVGTDADLIEGCTAEFWEHGTVQQRVFDALQVVSHLRSTDWWNGDLVVFGGSEGGAVAAMLAPFVPETDAVIVFSSGIGIPVGDMIRSAIPPQAVAEAETVFAEARENPTGSRRWGGASYRWWADSIDLVPALALVGSEFPLLLVHGERDQFAPVVTARASAELWSESVRPNTTYREYPGYDHFMIDESGQDHSDEVMEDIAAWLGEQSNPD